MANAAVRTEAGGRQTVFRFLRSGTGGTLRARLTFEIGALICLCIGLVAVQSLAFLRDELHQAVRAENTAFLKSLSQHLEAALRESQLDLIDLGRVMPRSLLRHPQGASDYLSGKIGMRRIFDGGLRLYRADGSAIAASSGHSVRPITPEELAALNITLATDRPLISEPYATAGPGPAIAMFAPIHEGGRIVGALEGTLRLDGHNIIASVPRTYVGRDGYVFVADRYGRVIAHPDPRRLMTKLTEPSDTLPLEDILAGHMIMAKSYTVHGQPMLTSIRRLPMTGWLVGINLPQSEAFSPLVGAQHYIVFGALGILTILLLAMSQMMRRLMTPLETIAGQIRAITQSGHSAGRRIRLASPPREVAQLARDFNEMLETLEQHRDEIAHREKRFRALIEDSPDTLAVMNRHGELIFVAPSSFDEGFPQGGAVRPTVLDNLHPDDRARGRAAVREVIDHPEGTARIECRVRDRSGAWRHYETILRNRLDDPDIGGIVLSTRDVTERRAAEAATRIEEQRLRVALVCADLAVFSQDTDLRYTWAFNTHLLADDSETLGRTDDELLPADIAGPVTAFKRRVLESGIGDRTEVAMAAGERARTFHLVAEPLRESDGTISGLVGAVLETTDQRRTEEMLRHAQRLESLGLLTGGIAHDFNNHLGIITANLECILAALEAGSPLRRFGKNALMAAQHGAGLTRNLLAFARQQKLAPVRLDLNALLRDVSGVLRPVAGPSIAFHLDLDPQLWPCEVDAGELQNALVNLIVNACDAMPEGGELTIRTANIAAGGAGPQAHGAQDHVCLCVHDTGHGMTAEVARQAFDPFFTTKRAGEGTGLGLSSVYGFARQSGGHVAIDSAPGAGTTVALYLPRA